MVTQMSLGDIVVDLVRKNIKNIHLSVQPPMGMVRVSAVDEVYRRELKAAIPPSSLSGCVKSLANHA